MRPPGPKHRTLCRQLDNMTASGHTVVKANLTMMNGPSKLGRPETTRESQSALCFGQTGGLNLHPRRQIKMPHKAAFSETMVCLSRVGLCPARLRAIRPSLSTCASGPPTSLGVSASNDPVLSGSSGRREALTCQGKLACTETQRARFRTSGLNRHPRRQIKTPREAAFLSGGEGGIRTHVPGLPDHLISSQRRYGHFGTSPHWCAILPAMSSIANLPSGGFDCRR